MSNTTKLTVKMPTQIANMVKNLAEQAGRPTAEFAGDLLAYGLDLAIKDHQDKLKETE